MRKHACRKPYVSHLFCYFSVNPSVVRTVCRSTADSLDRYFHTSLSLATSSAAAAAAQKKYTSAHNSSLPKNTRGSLFNAGRRRGLHRFFFARAAVFMSKTSVSHAIKVESRAGGTVRNLNHFLCVQLLVSFFHQLSFEIQVVLTNFA